MERRNKPKETKQEREDNRPRKTKEFNDIRYFKDKIEYLPFRNGNLIVRRG